MRSGARVAGWGLLLAGFLSWGTDALAAGAEQIPEVHSTSFAGRPVDLPAMLKGKVGVLVLGFSKDSRSQVTVWGRRLSGDYRGSADVVYFELPMLASVPRLLRGMVLGSIRSGVSEAAQPHFAPLLQDEARWRSLAHYSKATDAYVLVVDGDGLVRSVTAGEATDAAYGEVKQRVDDLRRLLTP